MHLNVQNILIGEIDYLQGELNSDIRDELIDGKVYAMAGTSKNHDKIVVNILANLHSRDPASIPYSSDMQVKVAYARVNNADMREFFSRTD